MEKTAKITACEFKQEFNGNKGIIYYHKIELDNGDKGEIGTLTKLPDKLEVGKTLTYTITPASKPGYPDNIRAVNNSGGFKGGGRAQEPYKQKARTMALSFAKDFNLEVFKVEKNAVTAEKVLVTANIFYDWLMKIEQ